MATYNAPIDEIIDSSISTQLIRRATKRLPRRLQKLLLITMLVFVDTSMILLACGAAYWLRFTLSLPVFQLDVVPFIGYYQKLTVFFVPITLFIFYMSGLFNQRNILGGTKEYSLIFRATSISILLVIVIGFLDPDFILARGWLLSAWILSFCLWQWDVFS
jgi:hypothetical protein